MTHLNDIRKGDLEPAEDLRTRAHLRRLLRRTILLDAAIALAAVGGASTCGAALMLFVGSVREAAVEGWLIGLFALALVCTVVSLVAFMGDTLLAWHGLRREGPLPRSMGRRAGE
jgi:hypothetical protein